MGVSLGRQRGRMAEFLDEGVIEFWTFRREKGGVLSVES